ncbi:hypothetical protein BLS_003905 [Venturia inaequalis]|uniref:RNA-binding S4 domain-containing protein n=1 Tax=Venturia inaequalis TaxID=5025 RepID=A0A8H3V7A4_VENIN|nr:hypothetical protein BLS_003905 [Venturia inaequalis]KAE9981963.1 hypothetical protein EG328_011312 [Venturia inaequalis]KAE9993836.1 hypothetical protein EG327_003086 [Venturia inaequalis]
MPRGRKHFHGLKKIKVRQTWNKYNLYNISRLKDPFTATRTFFQQKWSAKAQARAYHGEHIREGQWTQMFSRYIPAVVPMDPKMLARDDGATQGAGRGSGKEVEPLTKEETSDRALDVKAGKVEKPQEFESTPYMCMTFYPQERRLDIAIFRALFASSARQARQFVVHGFVKVNGKKMQFPGYLLNPGDMFSVDPEMVLWATGTPERKHRTLKVPDDGGVWYKGEYIPAPGAGEDKGKRSAKKSTAVEETEEQIADEVAEVEEDDADDVEAEGEEESPEQASASRQAKIHKALVKLRADVVSIPKTNKDLSAKRKQDIRALSKDLKTAISQSNKSGKVTVENQKHWEQWLYDILKTIPKAKIPASVAHLEPADAAEKPKRPPPRPSPASESRDAREPMRPISEHMRLLESYPNSTPAWSPRDYMSAFAFIPRYLEVNQNVCSAVYLRHPVARPGLAEVPSPFGIETGLLAFQWYLRRR